MHPWIFSEISCLQFFSKLHKGTILKIMICILRTGRFQYMSLRCRTLEMSAGSKGDFATSYSFKGKKRYETGSWSHHVPAFVSALLRPKSICQFVKGFYRNIRFLSFSVSNVSCSEKQMQMLLETCFFFWYSKVQQWYWDRNQEGNRNMIKPQNTEE